MYGRPSSFPAKSPPRVTGSSSRRRRHEARHPDRHPRTRRASSLVPNGRLEGHYSSRPNSLHQLRSPSGPEKSGHVRRKSSAVKGDTITVPSLPNLMSCMAMIFGLPEGVSISSITPTADLRVMHPDSNAHCKSSSNWPTVVHGSISFMSGYSFTAFSLVVSNRTGFPTLMI